MQNNQVCFCVRRAFRILHLAKCGEDLCSFIVIMLFLVLFYGECMVHFSWQDRPVATEAEPHREVPQFASTSRTLSGSEAP